MDHLVSAALLPSVVLFVWIFKHDKIEKEPFGLLLKIFIFGALTTVSAIVFGTILEEVGNVFFENQSGYAFLIFDNFITTALIEEGGKYVVTKRLTWKNPNFNYTFDAVVYAVTASLGFATLENLLYVLDGDLSVALMRAVLSVPGHVIDAIFMGSYYGLAKEAEFDGDRAGMKHNLRLALWVPVFTHGFYDFCLSAENDMLLIAFLIFEVVVTIHAIRKVRKLSREDHAI